MGHILTMAAPVAIGMLTQIAYQLVDLYFVTRISVAATAGVNAAGNAVLVIVVLTQILGVGTVALVAQAVGRKDHADANLAFNQSMVLSAASGAITIALLYVFIHPYLHSVAADAATIDAGATFMFWVLPGYVLTLPMTVLSSALRGIGIVKPTISIYMFTVIVNAILAPILIAGWGTGAALGVKGAGLATSISTTIGLTAFIVYFHRLQRCMATKRELMSPQFKQWGRILSVGLPAGGDMALYFFYTAVMYYAIQNFGASAQAGFGIGSRILHIILLPAVAIAVAVGPIVGQNFGAKNSERVREAFRMSTLIGVVVMIAFTVLVQWWPRALLGMFDADASSIAVATVFLQLMSWAFVPQALVCMCTSMFQGLGNTLPSMVGTSMRFFVFTIPVLWLSMQPTFRIETVWYLSVASLTLQAIVSLWMLRLEFTRRLRPIAGSGVQCI